MTLARQYAKLCDLRDFDDPELLGAIRSLVPERDPLTHIERKVWEFAMVMLFLKDTGHLDGRSRVLSVGAGNERILFWLTNHVGEVVATDIYGEGHFAAREAHASMLEDPSAHAPAYAWQPERLRVLAMDGRALEFADGSFDAVFTVSSIEHFGAPEQIARAASEIGRVLRPGGHAIIVTECLVSHHPLDTAPVDFAIRAATLGRRRRRATLRRRARLGEVLTRRELDGLIVEPSKLAPMQPIDMHLSPETFTHITTATADGHLNADGGDTYPLILMRISRSVFTSACLVLVKSTPG
jgi:SAM-dependent methyltransferase